jgi:ATP-dependent DNA ligase
LETLVAPPGFTGNAPGGPSRWSTERSGDWQPLKPVLVVEVRYDHVTGGRFRHGTKLIRFRPDKAPEQCTFDQLGAEARPSALIACILER